MARMTGPDCAVMCNFINTPTQPVASVIQLVTPNLLTFGHEFDFRCGHTNWDFSSLKMPNKCRAIKSLVRKMRLHGRRGKATSESSREKN